MVSSILGAIGLSGNTGGSVAYATAKAGLFGLTYSLAADYATENIRANCIIIGSVHTPMVAHMGADARERRRQMVPTQTEGTAWDIAHGAVYLASDEARWVTGIPLPIDGGVINIRPPPSSRHGRLLCERRPLGVRWVLQGSSPWRSCAHLGCRAPGACATRRRAPGLPRPATRLARLLVEVSNQERPAFAVVVVPEADVRVRRPLDVCLQSYVRPTVDGERQTGGVANAEAPVRVEDRRAMDWRAWVLSAIVVISNDADETPSRKTASAPK